MILYGAGGHARVIIDIILSSTNYIIDGVFDDFLLEEAIHNIPLLRSFSKENKKDIIISVGNNKTRKKIADSLSVNYLTAIHYKAVVSKLDVVVGEGSVIMANAVINANSKIGKHCIINTAAVVEHDCKIEDFAHISPNASLAGNVTIGEGTQVGLGANIIEGIKIGKWSVIGAGSTVIEDVPDFSVVVGSPAKFIKSSNK